MRNYDLNEQLIKTIQHPSRNMPWPTDRLKGLESAHRHAACPSCYKMGTLKVFADTAGKTTFKCDSCGSIHSKAVYVKNRGPVIAENWAGVLKQLDEYADRLEYRGVEWLERRCSRQAVEWVIWSQTELCSGDKQELERLGMNVAWACFLIVSDQAKEMLKNGLDVQALISLIKLVMANNRRAAKPLSALEMERQAGLERNSLNRSDRRRNWVKIENMIERCLTDWEEECLNAL